MQEDERTSYRILRRRLCFAGYISSPDVDEVALLAGLRAMHDQSERGIASALGTDSVLAARQVFRRTEMAGEIARRQAECQIEVDASWKAMRAFLASGADESIQPYIDRVLAARMRMETIPWLVEEDFRFLHGTGGSPQGLLPNAH